MKRVFLVHGFEGSPNGGWRPYLMTELEKLDVYACALPMPTPDDPKPSLWIGEIDRVLRDEDDEIYLVGHSLGVPAILRFLEETEKKVAGCVLVSGPIFKTRNEKVNRFLDNDFDFEKLKASGTKFAVIHGDNDPRVPLSDANTLSKELDAPLFVIPNGGHLNGSSGWTNLPQCLEALKLMMGI